MMKGGNGPLYSILYSNQPELLLATNLWAYEGPIAFFEIFATSLK